MIKNMIFFLKKIFYFKIVKVAFAALFNQLNILTFYEKKS